MQKDMFAEYLDPNSTVVKGSWSMIAA